MMEVIETFLKNDFALSGVSPEATRSRSAIVGMSFDYASLRSGRKVSTWFTDGKT